MSPKQTALKLYATACETHKRSDWRQACHALAEALGAEGKPQPKAPRPVSLVAFLAKDGINDQGGELRARDGDQWHKGAPFRRRLIREDGRSLDAAAEAAHDAGYFPDAKAVTMDGAENMQAVTGEHLLQAIEREFAGRPVYSLADVGLEPGYWDCMEPEERDWA